MNPTPTLRQIWAAAVCAALLPCAAARAGDEAPPDVLRPGDALLVRIGGLGGELPEYREIVDSDGNIEVPFFGFLAVAGKTPAAVEAEIAATYANARLATNAAVRLTYITHFEPPPPRANLVRIEDPRRPVAAPPPAAGP